MCTWNWRSSITRYTVGRKALRHRLVIHLLTHSARIPVSLLWMKQKPPSWMGGLKHRWMCLPRGTQSWGDKCPPSRLPPISLESGGWRCPLPPLFLLSRWRYSQEPNRGSQRLGFSWVPPLMRRRAVSRWGRRWCQTRRHDCSHMLRYC